MLDKLSTIIEHRWNDIDREDRSRGKICPLGTSSATNPTWSRM